MPAFTPPVLRQTLLALVAAGFVGFLAVVASVLYLRADLPKIHSMADYAPLQCSRIFSDDGYLVGEFHYERRTLVPFSAIPKHVIHAFMAAEDANFYEHEGVDYFGILRALLKNLRPGAHLQGASTITQQTVKTLVLGPERSYARKVREVLLSREMEQVLSKDEILYIYLNQIYFGSGAWGVEEAAQTYFGKSVRQVTLAEGALLAAIPKNPGRYNIKADPVAAKGRQRYVLEQMLAKGWGEAGVIHAAIAEPVPFPADPPAYFNKAPYYLEHIRKLLVEKFGEKKLYEGGLTVYTGMHAKAQSAAQTALRQGLEDLARKEGYAGAPLRIEVDRLQRYVAALHTEFTDQLGRRKLFKNAPQARRGFIWDLTNLSAAQLGDESAVRRGLDVAPLAEYQRVRAPVIRLDRLQHEAIVDLGSVNGRLSLKNMAWARRFAPRGGSVAPRDPSDVLAVGDVVTVEVAGGALSKRGEATIELQLVPEPKAEGALVSIEPHSRMVWALVGGYGNDGGGFNRATQALRQPGSAYKPVLYAAAISRNALTPATLCPDSPVVITDPWTGKPWKPENYEDGRYDGNITYRTALMRSKNTCSVRLLQKIGPEACIETGRAMGITSKMPANLTLALGTGDLTPMELANAYATIASGGFYAPPIFIRKVVDGTGQTLDESRNETQEALTPQVAYILTSMMRSVVDRGTATRALVLDRPLAGKTGTSQESRNVWFSGFSPELVATVWMGFDNNDPLGYETGSSAALPAWIRFMGAALAGEPAKDFAVPENIATVKIDPFSGQPSERPNAVSEVFVAGTEPTAATQQLPSTYLEDDDDLKAHPILTP